MRNRRNGARYIWLLAVFHLVWVLESGVSEHQDNISCCIYVLEKFAVHELSASDENVTFVYRIE